MTPEEVIKDIRRLWGIGTESDTVQKLQKGLNKALQTLAYDLYASEAHFILELIQNADDNHYDIHRKDEVPSVGFGLFQNSIRVINNEVGFTDQNVRDLCDIGESKKTKRLGYIGEKGIGFKSVFRISDRPHIYSNGYRFHFDVRTPEDPLGYVVPHWLQSLPPDIRPHLTTIELPLKIPAANVVHFLDAIDSRLLLFLHKIQRIEVFNHFDNNKRSLSRHSSSRGYRVVREQKSKDKETLPKTEKTFVVSTLELQMEESVRGEARKGVETSHLTLAFPLNDRGESDRSQFQSIFAFLPVKACGFHFIVQGDFILTSSREDIHRDSAWNQRLRDNVGMAFIKALKVFQQDDLLKHTFYRYLPRKGEVIDEFFSRVPEDLFTKLSGSECILTASGTWRRPADVLQATPAIRALIPSDELVELLSKEFVDSQIDDAQALSRLGVNHFDFGHLVQCCSAEGWMGDKSSDWFAKLYRYLAADPPDARTMGKFRSLPLLRLSNGQTVGATAGVCFMGTSHVEAYEFGELLPVLDPNTWSHGSKQEVLAVTEFLSRLEVRKSNAYEIIEHHILPVYQTDAWKSIAAPTRVSHIRFIRDYLDEYLREAQQTKPGVNALKHLRDSLWLCSHVKLPDGRSTYMRASGLYLTPAYGASQELDSLLENIEKVYFVSDSYLTEGKTENQGKGAPENQKKRWYEFFQKLGSSAVLRVDVRDYRVVINRRSIAGTDYHLSPEFASIVADHRKTRDLLTFLDKVWTDSYHRYLNKRSPSSGQEISSFAQQLRSMSVPTEQGGTAKFCETVLGTAPIRNVFGSSVPILAVELKNLDFISDMNVTTLLQPSFAVERLRLLRDESSKDKQTYSKFYEFLDRRFLEDPEHIRSTFENESLILPSAGGNTCTSKEVCWRDLGPLFRTAKPPLQKEYPSLHDFFVSKLQVAEEPTVQDLAQAFETIAAMPSITDADRRTIIDIYYEFNRWLKRPDEENRTWFDELQKQAIYLTSQGKLAKNEGQLLINDDPDLCDIFAGYPTLTFLALTPQDVPQLERFINAIGVSRISQVVETHFVPSTADHLDSGWTNLLRTCSPYIGRYLWYRQNSHYQHIKNKGAFDSASRLTLWMIEDLTVKRILKGIEVAMKRISMRVGERIYVDASSEDNEDAIARELASAFECGDELADFIGLLFARRDKRKVENMFSSRGIPPLPSEDEQYFRDLQAGTPGVAPPPERGVLFGGASPSPEAQDTEEGQSEESDPFVGAPADQREFPAAAGPQSESRSSGIPWPRVISSISGSTDHSPEGRTTGGTPGFSEGRAGREGRESVGSHWAPTCEPEQAMVVEAAEFVPQNRRTKETGVTPHASFSSLDSEPANELDFQILEVRKAIGRWGEQWIARRYLPDYYTRLYPRATRVDFEGGFELRAKSDLLVRVEWLNAISEQHKPYDILVSANTQTTYVEAKSTSTHSLEWFDVSGQQWKFANEHDDSFLVYRVYGAGTPSPRLVIVSDLSKHWRRGEIEAQPVRVRL